MTAIKHQQTPAQVRKIRIRGKLFGTASRPRLTVFRSNQHLYLQVIDDEAQRTLVATSDVGKKTMLKGTKTQRATQLTENFLPLLQKKGIKVLIFDRGSYKYHGRVKAIAEALREGGIKV
ncbi:MAG TPA: 50S ribosomal protein L18 [Patescibacteria group bacterium]|jgi:large subunit ribosomal protein L18